MPTMRSAERLVRRTLLLAVPAAAVVAWSWSRLEDPRAGFGELVLLSALGLAPALARRTRDRIVVALVAALVAAQRALDVSPLDARPFDEEHDFFGPLLSRFADGFLGFYDVVLPFDGGEHPRLHGLVLLAVFGSCLAVGIAIAARRPLVASLALVAAAGWPATLVPGEGDVLRGAALLACVLLLLFGARRVPSRRLAQAALAAMLVVLAAAAASTSSAVAKGAFLDWQHWDPYTEPQKQVSVRFAWDSNYDGIRYPKQRTTVLQIKAPAPPASFYWRATTLDAVVAGHWLEEFTPEATVANADAHEVRDPLLPDLARNRLAWTKTEVTVSALRDHHLVAASVPVLYENTADLGAVHFSRDGVAQAGQDLGRGSSYTVWSYAALPRPAELDRSEPRYPSIIADGGRYLGIERGQSAPTFGPGREEAVAELFDDPQLAPYERLWRTAQEVVGPARSPYATAVALEAWFRSGRFRYDEQPPSVPGVPPLVSFVTETRRGYCQHFAGAMALMLRYLGVPSRVAAGFTSGTYDVRAGKWVVTDHDAHTWVEVWFDGYGWLPFDPTPTRGTLAGPYTTSSPNFDRQQARELVPGDGLSALPEGLRSLRLGAALGSLVGGAGADVPRVGEGGSAPSGESASTRGASLVGLLLVLALAALVALAAAKLVRRRARYVRRDPRSIAAACRQELRDFLLDQGFDVPESATLAELAQIVESEVPVHAGRFAAEAAAARYGPPARAADAARRARRELRLLRSALRRRLTTFERLRGLLSVRSLGLSG